MLRLNSFLSFSYKSIASDFIIKKPAKIKWRIKKYLTSLYYFSDSEITKVLIRLCASDLVTLLFRKRITKVLIRLRICAGWAAPLLFASNKVGVSHVEAHIN